MKRNVPRKSIVEKKNEIGTENRESSRISVIDVNRSRSKSRVSSTPGFRKSFAWRSDGKGRYKIPKYQNSYRLEPYLPFDVDVAETLLCRTMTEKLDERRYNPDNCMELCRNMSADVREILYKKDYDRVKYAVSMMIIENAGQSLVVANGRLWDTDRDTCSVYVYQNQYLYAVGMIVTTYYE